ncbi:MAG: hypothetical protein ACXVRA_10335, partial [Gaiellaceae bacterium]
MPRLSLCRPSRQSEYVIQSLCKEIEFLHLTGISIASSEAADDGCSLSHWRDITTIDDVGDEGLKGRQSLQRVE